jgi:acetoin utilization protein AcuB
MAVKDFMTKKVIYVSPKTKVAKAADIMKEQGIHRLPVIDNDKLVGLVTAGTIEKASPSVATSLSVYEMNYLLNKTTVGEVMLRDVLTISKYASLEDAVYRMRQNNIGVLPVVDDDRISGVITDKDVFGAFLKIAGYGEAGVRVRILMADVVGSLAQVADLLAEKDLDVRSIVQINQDNHKTVVEMQLTGRLSPEGIKAAFEAKGFEVDEIHETDNKLVR